MVSCCLQGWRLHNFPRQRLCQCSVALTVKKCFLMLRWYLLCFGLSPLPLVPALGTTEKSLAPSSLHPPLQVFTGVMV